MKDLFKLSIERSKTREILLTVLAGVVLFAASRSTARVENGRNTRTPAPTVLQSNLVSPNPALGTKPLKSFVCLSSWYGGDFDGQLTANGEIYDMYGETAAHPSLPLGSVVRVMNLSTRKSAIVRINDRGPYVPGRDLDVSYQVARELGFVRRGTARVRVELLKVPPSKSARPAN